MTRLPAECLDRAPEEVSRMLALALLEDTSAAAERLAHPRDTEALHDFRVALRRLRISLRAYRPYLKGSIPKKVRKSLRRLASSTNPARDAEVQLAWLTEQSDKLSAGELKGLGWLMKRLEQERAEPHADRSRRVALELAPVRKILTKKLSSWRVRLNETKRRSFKSVLGSLMQEQMTSLSTDLRAIRGEEDDSRAHAARISAKRLRYLVEPISKSVPGTGSVVKRLKELQDLLGDLHDTNLLISTIGTAMEASAVERARRLHRQALQPPGTFSDETASESPNRPGQEEQPGLLALARLLRNRRERLYREIESGWRGSGLDEFATQVGRLAAQLRATPQHQPAVRRFRLTGLPHNVDEQASTLVDEGWLPGDIDDCLRRERSPTGVRHFRLVRVGSQSNCTRISRRVFATLWPLTDGRRLQKRRYDLRQDDRLWRIDDLGGKGVIAETDATAPGEVLPLPDWLVPCLQEELPQSTKWSPSALAGKKSTTRPRPMGRSEKPAAPAPPPGRPGLESYRNTGNGRGNEAPPPPTANDRPTERGDEG